MIHFNALNFNVCCPEEVISFFWRSVYIVNNSSQPKRTSHKPHATPMLNMKIEVYNETYENTKSNFVREDGLTKFKVT